MRSLIAGITGCSGSYLAEYLLEKGYKVFGTRRKTSSFNNIKHILNRIKLLEIDLHNKRSIIRVLDESKPEQIYFLAGANNFNNLNNIYKTNVEGTLNFFEAIIESACQARIIIISSSAVYGIQKDINPVKENDELLPLNHYGLSKVFQEKTASYYYKNHNIDVIIVRPFNITGPREKPSLVCTDFARQIVDIENGKKEPIVRVGNLESKRDFTDVRDMIKGYELLVEKGVKGEIYNLCSGKAYSIKMILDKLLSMSTLDIKIVIDQKKFKSKEINIQLGDSSKISSQTGWMPHIPLDKTLEDILTYNREAVEKENELAR